MLNQLFLAAILIIFISTSYQVYTKIYLPWFVGRLEKEMSGLIKLDLCPYIIKSSRQKDGSYTEKVMGRNFPDIKKYSWGVDIKFKTPLADKVNIEKKLPGISNALQIPFEEVQEVGHQHFRLLRDLLPSMCNF
jgi:hypothetical protein